MLTPMLSDKAKHKLVYVIPILLFWTNTLPYKRFLFNHFLLSFYVILRIY